MHIYGLQELAGELFVHSEARIAEDLTIELEHQYTRKEMEHDPDRLAALRRWESAGDDGAFESAVRRERELQDWDNRLTERFLATASLEAIESWLVQYDGFPAGTPETHERAKSYLRDQRRAKLRAV
ncbi:MAG: hypothetical protein WEA10_06785 [Actinomycetota bacterium]